MVRGVHPPSHCEVEVSPPAIPPGYQIPRAECKNSSPKPKVEAFPSTPPPPACTPLLLVVNGNGIVGWWQGWRYRGARGAPSGRLNCPPPSGNSGRRRRGILDYLYCHIVKYDGLKDQDDLIVGKSEGVVGVKPTDRGIMIILRTPSGKNCGDYSAITITIL